MKINLKTLTPLLILLAGSSGAAQAALLKVTATGTVGSIFGFTDSSVVPFTFGDTFSYSIIVNDSPTLDTNPLPEFTIHNYTPNFQENVAGAASISFGSYTIPATNVSNSFLSISDNAASGDKIEINSQLNGAPIIAGIAPTSFSIKMTDSSGAALSSADISPAAFLSSDFIFSNVFLNMDANTGACLARRCAIGTVNNVTVETLVATPIPPSAWLFGSGILGMAGLARRKTSKM